MSQDALGHIRSLLTCTRHTLSHRRRIIRVHAILRWKLLSDLRTLIWGHLSKVLLEDLPLLIGGRILNKLLQLSPCLVRVNVTVVPCIACLSILLVHLLLVWIKRPHEFTPLLKLLQANLAPHLSHTFFMEKGSLSLRKRTHFF